MEDPSPEGSLPPWAVIHQTTFLVKLMNRFRPPQTPQASYSLADLACGIGNHASELVQLNHHVQGYDINPNAVKRARAKVPRGRFDCTDICDPMGFIAPRKFDATYLIYGTWCTLSPEKQQRLMSNVIDQVKPGGLFFFDGFFAQEPTNNPHGRPSGPVCIWEDSYYSDPGGFWGLIPKKIREREWYYPHEHLYVEDYQVHGKRFFTWKKPIHPRELPKFQGFELLDVYAGSYGVSLPSEVQAMTNRNERELRPLGEIPWTEQHPWFTGVYRNVTRA